MKKTSEKFTPNYGIKTEKCFCLNLRVICRRQWVVLLLVLYMPLSLQELILHVADTSVAKRIFIRVVGYNDLYKRQRNPDVELMSQIIDEAAQQRKEMVKHNG